MALTTQEIVTPAQTILIGKPKTGEPCAKRFKVASSPKTITQNVVNVTASASVIDTESHVDHESEQRAQAQQIDYSDSADMGAICSAPKRGEIVNRRVSRRAGPYILGPKLAYNPIDSISAYIAWHEDTYEFVQLKILTLSLLNHERLTQDERQGKMLMHTEYTLLSLLEHEEGVIRHRGMFSDYGYVEQLADEKTGMKTYTGVVKKRIILVLDCLMPHEFNPKSYMYINLQQYLVNRRRISEFEAFKIIYEVLLIVERLHKRNIIHRDIKLGNIILNTCNNRITIINFCLGKYMLNENYLLRDQRGSPAYISPDVLSAKPYKGKPSDVWALGVVLYIMLYRQFPFYEATPAALFRKIKAIDYTFPPTAEVSTKAEKLVIGMLNPNPEKRLTVTQVRETVETIINAQAESRMDRVVPEINEPSQKSPDFHYCSGIRLDQFNNVHPPITNDQIVPTGEPAIEPANRSASSTSSSNSSMNDMVQIPRHFREVQSPCGPNLGSPNMWRWLISQSPPLSLSSLSSTIQQRFRRPWNIQHNRSPEFPTSGPLRAPLPYSNAPASSASNVQRNPPNRVRHARRNRLRLEDEYVETFDQTRNL